MTVYIRFNIDNDAYADESSYDMAAVAETVREVAQAIEALDGNGGELVLSMHQNIRDRNGNTVGTFAIKDKGLL